MPIPKLNEPRAERMPITARVDPEIARRIEDLVPHAERVLQRRAGDRLLVRVRRSDVVRAIILRGLDRLECELADDGRIDAA